MKFNASLLRASRAYLGLSQANAAELIGVSHPTLKRMENAKSAGASKSSLDKVLTFYKSKGIVMIEGEDHFGVEALPAA